MSTHRRLLTIAALALLIMLVTASVAAAAPRSATGSGFRALTGDQARAFPVPADTRAVWEARYPQLGLTQTHYQQYVGQAEVLGGQLTILRKAGQQVAVIGSHYPGLAPSNQAKLSAGAARAVAERDVGADGRWIVKLMIDPGNGRYFYHVENQRFDSRWIFWVDAVSGAKLNKYEAITTDTGIGVKGDTKTLDASLQNGTHVLISSDNRQATYDAESAHTQRLLPGTLFTDPDGIWDTPGRTSPGHPAAVDAHYYANVTDDFYGATFGRNSIDDKGLQIVSSVHYSRNYNNAFWNGFQMVYGDGDGVALRELSGGLDVVAHELTHGVTQYTSNLIYQNESGALNESFSDIMGNTTEFFAAAHGLDPAASPDWLVGEDIVLLADAVPGIRNMTDPQEDADPDHYSELLVGSADNGFVHSNSGISNHAYYLLVNGGKNAGCDNVGSDGHQHTADCDVTAKGIGVAKAEQIFYLGYTSLPENATIANARYSTEAAAVALYGAHSRELTSTGAAWQAVGVTSAPPAPPCNVDVTTLPFESEHPYSSNFTCTWTYDNGAPNFSFHFSVLDVEENFDYVDILDANGTVLQSLTGAYRTGVTSVVIPTSVGKVRLRTDPLINKRGFIVDAVIQQ